MTDRAFPILTPGQQGQSAFRTARERKLCGFTRVAEITCGAPTWLGGIGGMRDSAHLGAAFGPGGGFPLQAAGGMWHRAAVPLVFVVVFGRKGTCDSKSNTTEL